MWWKKKADLEVETPDEAVPADRPRIVSKFSYYRKVSDRYVARCCGELRDKEWEEYLDSLTALKVRWKHHRSGYMLNPSKEATYIVPGQWLIVHEASGRTQAQSPDAFFLHWREDGTELGL